MSWRDGIVVQRAPWILGHALRRWPGLLAVLGTMLLQTLLTLIAPWPMKILIDNVLYGLPVPDSVDDLASSLGLSLTTEDLLVLSIAATVVVFVISWGVSLMESLASVSYGQRLTYDVAEDLVAHSQRLSLRFHRTRPLGDLVRRVTSDSSCVSTLVNGGAIPTVVAVVSLAMMLFILWELDPRLTLISLAVGPFMFLLLLRYMGPMSDRGYEREQADGRVYQVVEESLSAAPLVQTYAAENAQVRHFTTAREELIGATLRLTSVQLRFGVLVGLCIALGTAAVMWVGGVAVLEGELTVGSIVLFLSYMVSMYAYLEGIANAPVAVDTAVGGLRRVSEILDAEPEVRDRPGARPLAAVRGHITAKGVSFGYEPDRAVLQDISFEARPGEKIALVGPTGAGKSTLVSLVPRLMDPWSGTVTIDGHDLRDVQLRSLRERVALVLQEPFLFPITVAENIAYGRPDASRAEIEAAATAANAQAFIERLEAGYDTILGERGATLSGGERQRLSIARALLKDAPVLILDEPTSALDAETERSLLEALDRLMVGRTTLIIAHRLSTIRGADRILVLRDGRIIESGSHATLMAEDGFYAYLNRLQFKDQAELDAVTTEAPV